MKDRIIDPNSSTLHAGNILLAVLALANGRCLSDWLLGFIKNLFGDDYCDFDKLASHLQSRGEIKREGHFTVLGDCPCGVHTGSMAARAWQIRRDARKYITEAPILYNLSGQFLKAFANNDSHEFCRISKLILEELEAANSLLEMRYIYDIIAGCFISFRPDLNKIEVCKNYIDTTYNLLITFQRFPFMLRRSICWYYKACSLAKAIGNYETKDTISSASLFIIGYHNSIADKVLKSLFLPSDKFENQHSNIVINLDIYLSIKDFLDGNFIKSINSIYCSQDSGNIDFKNNYFMRSSYIYACTSAIYLGEYDIALGILNIGIQHATAWNTKTDIECLQGLKIYVDVFRSDYESVRKNCQEFLDYPPRHILTYKQLWQLRALVCMYWRLGEKDKAFHLYQSALKESIDCEILHMGCVVASMLLEILTDWHICGFGHPFGNDVMEEIEKARQSPSIMLRNIATRCKINILAHRYGWLNDDVTGLLGECMRNSRLLASPVQRAKTLFCGCYLALAQNDQTKAIHYAEEIVDTASRYGCPIIPDNLLSLLQKDTRKSLTQPVMPTSSINNHLDKEDSFIIHSASMQELLNKVHVLAPANTTVLLLGESGVGKEHIARKLHELSGRKGAFVAVNLASIPGELFESEFCGHEKGAFTGANQKKIGLMEQADGGTLFLDEVGDLPLNIQVKLLRLLQEKSFRRVGSVTVRHSDFRLISATNKNLKKSIQDGLFREDLYYRINVFTLKIPPLRERQHDVIFIAEFFKDLFLKKYALPPRRFSGDELRFLTSYGWPGNVRELKNYIERYVLLAESERSLEMDNMLTSQEEMQRDDGHPPMPARDDRADTLSTRAADAVLPASAAISDLSSVNDGDFMKTFISSPEANNRLPTLEILKNAYVEHVYRHTRGNVCGKNGMASILGISKVTAYAWIEKLGLRHKYETTLVPRKN